MKVNQSECAVKSLNKNELLNISGGGPLLPQIPSWLTLGAVLFVADAYVAYVEGVGEGYMELCYEE